MKLRILGLSLTLALSLACAAQSSRAPQIRKAGVAGSFYPSDPQQLAAMVDGYVAKAKVPGIEGAPIALIAPHAGYQYSGAVAGHSYALLKNRHYRRVVVIAPSHYEAFPFASVYDGDAYETPLGQVAVDKDFARKLAGSSPALKLSSRGHIATAEARDSNGQLSQEHAVEVQLPFLQRTLGSFQVVPVVMGVHDYEHSRALGVALAKLIGKERDTLIVASSDLSHYHPYDSAVQLDHKALNAITQWDYLSAARNFEMRVWEACGGAPIVAAMIAAERLGADQAKLLAYANSGDATGDHSRVVGYGAVALYRNPQAKAAESAYSLTGQERDSLLRLAKQSVESRVRDHKPYEPPAPLLAALDEERGAFVTLTQHGRLRGCIGYLSPSTPLYLTVRDVADAAATHDSRFSPVSVRELDSLEYEISVLSPMRHVSDMNQIVVGRHGLLMRNGRHEGLLLPQVPGEFGWDRKTFLEETCQKAGMNPECWQSDDTDVFLFTALVFDEHTPTAERTAP